MIGIKKALVTTGKVLLAATMLGAVYRVGQNNGAAQDAPISMELGANLAFEADDACADPKRDQEMGAENSFQGENNIPLICAPPGYTTARLTITGLMARQIGRYDYTHP